MKTNEYSRHIWSKLLTVLTSLVFTGCERKETSQHLPPLVVVSYGGGAWQESHKKAFFEPFSQTSGVSIESVVWKADYGKLKTDVEANNVKWDVVEVTAAQFVRGKQDGLYERITLSLDSKQFVVGAIDEHGIANVYWSTVLAFLPEQFQGPTPSSWIDFWDTKKFPGPRALYDDPRGNLEFALLADGVQPSKLYPLDVNRAFASLDKLKPNIRVWWEDGSQPVQLLTSKQVIMSTAWNGRLFAARKDAAKVQWDWNGAAHDLDYWVIPKGAKNKEMGQRFLWFASQPAAMAVQTELVGYGPANIKAMQFIPEEVRQQLPTNPTNYDRGFLVNSEWWSKNEAEVMQRWVKWKSQ